MRKIMIVLLSFVAITACNNKTPDKPKEEAKLDPYAKLYVNYQATKADENGLETAEYIVRNCAFLRSKIMPDWGGNFTNGLLDIGSQEHTYNIHRDFVNYRFVFDGVDAVTEDGQPGRFFELADVVFTVAKFDDVRVFPTDIKTLEGLQHDTVAYIPNTVMLKIKEDILTKIKEGDIEACHKILEKDFVFIPIKDGAEWRSLEGK